MFKLNRVSNHCIDLSDPTQSLVEGTSELFAGMGKNSGKVA